MNRNVSIVVALLIVVVIAGYLVWLRSKVAAPVTPKIDQQVQVEPSVMPTVAASSSAAAAVKEASATAKPKVSTPSSTRR